MCNIDQRLKVIVETLTKRSCYKGDQEMHRAVYFHFLYRNTLHLLPWFERA